MKKITALAAISTMATVLLVFCNQPVKKEAALVAGESISHDSLVKRGAYMVSIMGCNDCHSPKIMGPQGPYPDPDRLLSGHPAGMPTAKFDTVTAKNWILFNGMLTSAVGPWGISFAANITSDSTGIGAWTEEQFFKAIREGKYKGLDGGRMLLPPMPWQEIAKTSDDDLKAIFAYLKSTKPVKNVVPEPVMPAMGKR
jgi:cytochrome c553